VLFPLTTDLALLESLADAARGAGASFFAAIPIDAEPTAKQAIAQTMPFDDDLYAMLFHLRPRADPARDRAPHRRTRIRRGMADFILPPRWDERSNWNAAVLLTLVASRMIAMELDLDLAGVIARSRARSRSWTNRSHASRVRESVDHRGLDETSVEMLGEWLSLGSAAFAEYVHERWRLRRA
jgi:hypothetical protein